MAISEKRNLDEIVWRDDLYPRLEPNPATIQRYAQDLDVLPPIEINQHNELIDGYHRWTAHKKAQAVNISVVVTQTSSDVEFLALAAQKNAAHGLQLGRDDKRKMAIRLYAAGTGKAKDEIAKILSVSPRTVSDFLNDIDRTLKEERDKKIFDMWLACHTQEDIAEAVGVTKETVSAKMEESQILETLPKSDKLSALHEDPDWKPQLYDIWNFNKNNNSTKHFGNTAIEIVDNLLYLYTNPFDTVIDPFGGGGSTIDICKKRLRRYWVSDRKPVPERPDIRSADITNCLPGPSRWGEVKLVYLDPPYWRQAKNEYSNDPADLANMPLEQFNDSMLKTINGYASKLAKGSHIACIIQPTQWRADDKQTVYHDLDLIAGVGKKLKLKQHIICPYSTEQFTPQMVDFAKDNKMCLVLSRRLIVWEIL